MWKGRTIRKIVAVVLAVLMTGMLLTACTENKNGQQDAADAEDYIKVGIVIPQTGVLTAFGAGTEEMTQYALDQINEAGGLEVDGTVKKLKLFVGDSQSEPEKARQVAQQMISGQNVDVMLTSHTADTTVPVSEACEEAGILCLSVDTPDEAWAASDHQYSYHAGFNTENELLCFLDAWKAAGVTSGKIGVMHADDAEGQAMMAAITAFAAAYGYEICDPGAYTPGTSNYSAMVRRLKEKDCEIVAGVMLTSDFGTFYRKLKASGYMPEVCTVAKAALFEEDVAAVGADRLCSEVWWTTEYPYVSSISGESCEEIGQQWLKLTKDSYVSALAGYDYANVEILYQILKEAKSLDIEKLCAAADTLDTETVIGRVRFNEQHYSVQSLVTGQWIYNEDGTWSRYIIANTQVPDCSVTSEFRKIK